MNTEVGQQTSIVILTGLAGAGHSTAINALEDAGWDTLDNVPMSLLLEAVDATGPAGSPKRLAIALSSRTRGFSAESMINTLAALRAKPDCRTTLIFMDASDETLQRRYAETRRRHPAAPDENVTVGIGRERTMLAPLQNHADLVLDTTGLTPHELKEDIQTRFGSALAHGLTVSIQSFGFKRGAPRDAEMVIDCRFLRNPHWVDELRPLDGRDAAVAAFVAEDPLFDRFLNQLSDMVLMLLPAYRAEGKAYFGIALGCTGGRHRSVFVAESLTERLEAAAWTVKLRHRDL